MTESHYFIAAFSDVGGAADRRADPHPAAARDQRVTGMPMLSPQNPRTPVWPRLSGAAT